MSKLALLLLASVVLAGCGTMGAPQTRDEYRKALSGGIPLTMVETHTVNRRFEDVVKVVTQKAAECLNVDSYMKRSEGGITTMNTKEEYRTVVRTVDSNLAELTTQFQWRGVTTLQKVPEGGFYSQAMDIERIAANKTKLTYYGPSFRNITWPAFKKWSEGQANEPCPS